MHCQAYKNGCDWWSALETLLIYHVLRFCGLHIYNQMKCSYSETDLKYFNSKTRLPERSREFGYGSAYIVPKVVCIYMWKISRFQVRIIFILC